METRTIPITGSRVYPISARPDECVALSAVRALQAYKLKVRFGTDRTNHELAENEGAPGSAGALSDDPPENEPINWSIKPGLIVGPVGQTMYVIVEQYAEGFLTVEYDRLKLAAQ